MASFSIKGTKELRRALERAGDNAERFAAAALFEEAESIMARSKREVPVDMGPLRSSGHVKPPARRFGKTVVELAYGGPAATYAVFVHEGTGPAVGRPPFFPPTAALAGWARRHGIPDDALFPLARAIGRRGLKPSKYLERPLNEARRGMANRLAKRIERRLERSL